MRRKLKNLKNKSGHSRPSDYAIFLRPVFPGN